VEKNRRLAEGQEIIREGKRRKVVETREEENVCEKGKEGVDQKRNGWEEKVGFF
jgi:hypothetical protein